MLSYIWHIGQWITSVPLEWVVIYPSMSYRSSGPKVGATSDGLRRDRFLRYSDLSRQNFGHSIMKWTTSSLIYCLHIVQRISATAPLFDVSSNGRRMLKSWALVVDFWFWDCVEALLTSFGLNEGLSGLIMPWRELGLFEKPILCDAFWSSLERLPMEQGR